MNAKVKLNIKKDVKDAVFAQIFAPKNVLSLDKLGKVYVANEEDCIGCGRCEELCPDFAIFVLKEV